MTRRSCVPPSTALAMAIGMLPGLASSGLSDPTRPLAGATSAETPSAAGPRAPAPAVVPAPAPAEPQLQSLQLPRDGVASALVDGQLLRAGQRWNAFDILAIDAQGVLARGPGGPQRWTLVGVQYLDPKLRPRPTPPAAALPAAAVPSNATSATPPGTAPVPLQTAQWQFTPAKATPAPVPALPPVTRLSWADLVAPAPKTIPPGAAQPAREPSASLAQGQRVPPRPAARMPVAAGASQQRAVPAWAALPQSPSPSTWRGLPFAWPAASHGLTSRTVAQARGPLRGPVPPSVVQVRPKTGTLSGAHWVALSSPAAPVREWWTPKPAPQDSRPLTMARTPARPASRLPVLAAARPTLRQAPAPTYAVRAPLPPILPRTTGPRLVGVVALNKESP